MGGALSTLWNKPIQDAAAVSETGPRVVEMSNRALVADFIVTAEGLRKIRDRNVMSFYKFDAEAGKSLIRSCEGDLCVQDFSSSVYNLYSYEQAEQNRVKATFAIMAIRNLPDNRYHFSLASFKVTVLCSSATPDNYAYPSYYEKDTHNGKRVVEKASEDALSSLVKAAAMPAILDAFPLNDRIKANDCAPA
eukprot:GEMP01058458.1.p1 GENE.GEMP01058458.1~~GEMP01058458.1.p1  ORF type:complete len:206 (+),score=26.42 GEMP01058458.1:45-620(+)